MAPSAILHAALLSLLHLAFDRESGDSRCYNKTRDSERTMTHKPDPLKSRDAGILHTIVRAYMEAGEPVGSQSVARVCQNRFSAATVRNVMAALDEQGYLSQPHTSAGRVPTNKAILSYVQSLAVRVVSRELQRMRHELESARSLEQRVERSSHILTALTSNVGIAAAIRANSEVLDQIELIALADRRILMVVITGDQRARNQVVALEQPMSEIELVSIRNYVNHNFSGWTLESARAELQRRLDEASAAYDAVLSKLVHLHTRGLLDVALAPEVHMEGASNLVGIDLHLTKEAMRDLFRTLEEKKRLLQLLDRFLEQDSDEPDIHVGLSEAHPAMGQLSLIGVTVREPGGFATKVAVLGPMRMNYAKAISAVVHMQQALKGLSS